MTHERREFGNRGEDLAAVFFTERGFRVVHRNWACALGEIDLIVEKEGRTHFIEVKTRQTLTFGYPEESITRTKLKHLARAVEVYIVQHPLIRRTYQVDALAILMLGGQPPDFHYIEQIL